MKPRIGITTSYKDGMQGVDHHYIHAIEQSGGVPVIVPMLQTADAMRDFAAILDGLLMTGGPGITRGLLGKLPEDLPPVDPVRDTADALIYEAVGDRPVLGICYGMQFINAMSGGTIYADVMAQHDGSIAHSAGRGGTEHPVNFDPDTHIRRVFGQDSLLTNTYHVQALADVGPGLRVAGRGPDGVIEAIESEDGRLIGVQFHPERMYDQTKPLFEDFIQRCRR